jgi:hypothetical protein
MKTTTALIIAAVLYLAFHYVTYASECDSQKYNCEQLKM